MTDKEAYELLVKYSGEQGIVMIKEMIHEVGIDKALENINKVYVSHGQPINNDIKWWIRQAFKYIVESTKQAN